jgi:glycerophosphoryl diester phosphodiesterase
MVMLAQPADDCPACLRDLPRPLVMAHQGGEELWPSNTMYAFERAVALGVVVLEMDLHVTADGALVLIHDETVDRTTDGTGVVEQMTLAEVKALDAGHYWTADGGQTFPFRGQGITIATLEELFQTFPDMPMNIEIKLVENTPIVEPFCQLIRQYGKQDQILVASFHEDAMAEFRAVCPEVATSTSQNTGRSSSRSRSPCRAPTRLRLRSSSSFPTRPRSRRSTTPSRCSIPTLRTSTST